MKSLARINAPGVRSHFGYIVDTLGGAAIIKVSCKEDWMEWIETPHCIILGSVFLELL